MLFAWHAKGPPAHLDAAAAAADDIAMLTRRLKRAEGESTAIKLIAERRLQLKALTEHVSRLGIWTEVPKSERHVLAGKQRWAKWQQDQQRAAR